MDKKDGGPAFPEAVSGLIPIGGPGWLSETLITRLHPGMSLRDYFAAAALTGILSKMLGDGELHVEGRVISAPFLAYEFADSMLAARESNG